MTIKHLKNAYSAIKSKPYYFLKIAVLDMVFAGIMITISMLFLQLIMEKTAAMVAALNNAQGADVFGKVVSSSQTISENASSVIKISFLFVFVTYILFVMFFGFSGYLIARVKDKKIGFARYVRQYSIVTSIFAVFFVVVFLILGNILSKIFTYGEFSTFHIFALLIVALLFSISLYFMAVAYSSLPDRSVKILLKNSFSVAFKDSKKNLAAFTMVLAVFLIMLLTVKYVLLANPIIGLFLLILLLFPYMIFARLFFRDVVKK